MEAVMYFPIPELCVATFKHPQDNDGTNPILFICRQPEHCDFINSNIIIDNEIIAHLNIDEQGVLGLFLEINNPSGFIITREDCQIIQAISQDGNMPIIPSNCLLTTIIIGADFISDPELARMVLAARKKSGIFNVTFGYRVNGNGGVYFCEEPVFIQFSGYTTEPSEQFAQQIVQ